MGWEKANKRGECVQPEARQALPVVRGGSRKKWEGRFCRDSHAYYDDALSALVPR